MKPIPVFVLIVIWFAACTGHNNSDLKNSSTLLSANQLFLFQENINPGESTPQAGAMYLTNKGNIIFNTINEQSDTQSYFWGKYKLTDTSLIFRLTDEYYYCGKWDARWDADKPDYANGKTRKIKPSEVTLFKTKSDSLSFFRIYSNENYSGPVNKTNSREPKRIDFWKYYETKEMKFYTWFYKQIPTLARL